MTTSLDSRIDPDHALGAWLARLEKLDPARIELGLERLQGVLQRLGLIPPPFRVLTVGGTNGKGSVVVSTAALLAATGQHRVGAYTSPHLYEYRERIAIAGVAVEPGALLRAFDAVESAREGVPLTYFEFSTAAALEVFRRAEVDIAVLEVGLGGRLDAVNAVNPDVAAVVSVGFDHQDWLGPDLDSIGREKAGIFRPGRVAIVGERHPPSGLLKRIDRIGAELWRIGRDFDAEPLERGWSYRGPAQWRTPLPEPALAGPRQRDNAAVALALCEALLHERLPDATGISRVLSGLVLPGRIERCRGDGLEWVLDVAHNAGAAANLAGWLESAEPRRSLAVIGMLRDKNPIPVVATLSPWISRWFVGGLAGSRGQDAAALAARAGKVLSRAQLCDNITQAIEAALVSAVTGDRIIVLGSFHTVAQARASGLLPEKGLCEND